MNLWSKSIALPFSKRRVSTRYLLAHSAYWVLATAFFLYEKRYLIHKASLPYFFACVSVRVLLLILIAYFNLHYFLPRYLLKKRYGAYSVALLLSVAGYLTLQSLFDYYLYGYVVGPMRNSDLIEALSYNFFSTLWYLALMLALKLSMDWYDQQLLIQKITVEKLHAEVAFLRSQVNPHFLFNALNNLYALTLKKSDEAPGVVLKLSELMEYMLYESNEAYIPLEMELGYLHNYMELERLRTNHQADIRVHVEGVAERCFIPPFLILPLLENAIKHGLGRANGNAFLHLDIQIDGALTVILTNSTAHSTSAERKGGIGLQNLKKRLELLYPGRYTLQTKEPPGVYIAFLKILL
ncbi:histidine kinase [Niabella sp. CC-SYL272]|uniref:sensor histidine kinase n=1 Tax=Niabella agricola TaxID=2891571 RepID=UPI001F2F51A9|nr:histidine kinase [Niabella agricola]MCF3108802.1 histidine kinase [Niabella agricola]